MITEQFAVDLVHIAHLLFRLGVLPTYDDYDSAAEDIMVWYDNYGY